jgi:hypothetical protein
VSETGNFHLRSCFAVAGGVYIFSYGWERFDVERALRLTAVIVVLSAAGFILLWLLLKFGRGTGGDAGGETAEVSLAPALRVAGSFVESGSLVGGRDEEQTEESDLSTLTCGAAAFPCLRPSALTAAGRR